MKGGAVSEKLIVHLDNAYTNDYKLVSTAQIWDGNRKVSEWTLDEPRALLHQAIEQVEPSVFTQVKIKKMLEKAASLFEAKSVTIEGK